MSVGTKDPRANPANQGGNEASLAEPKVRGESRYDRITSFLMAVVVGALLVVGWLWLVYLTNQAYASKVASPLEIVEVFGGGGGSPDGEIGSTEAIDVPGAEAGASASNNEEDAAAFEEPSVMLTPSATLDAVAEASGQVVAADFGANMPTGGAVASGKRSSKLGTGGPAYGFGPGDGGVSREQRWSIVYPTGQTLDEYARELDTFRVELATPVGNSLVYASNFSSATPTRRTGSPDLDKRLYFAWRGKGRKESDVALLRKAGIEVGEATILQFYPPMIEEILSRLEVSYRGRQPSEIRVTRFKVVPKGNGYGFDVLDQQTLR
ncbi:MAG: hypothetical protein ABI353_13785 [Isosphaeraceae bacterium]